MEFAGFKYTTNNIGDEIQSLAAEQFVPAVSQRFDRDQFHLQNPDKNYVIIFNGWFAHTPELAFPPPDTIIPIFISFHIAKEARSHFKSDNVISYLKGHEPIGCRDHGTVVFLQELGVEAFFTGCLTQTFPRREEDPQEYKVFLVDVPFRVKYYLPASIIDHSEELTHFTNDYGEFKMDIAKKLLQKYKEEASLVITTRVHCAIPCMAIGIPVIYLGDAKNSREAILKEFGLDIYQISFQVHPVINYIFSIFKISFMLDYWKSRKIKKTVSHINWEAKVPDLAARKEKISQILLSKIKAITI